MQFSLLSACLSGQLGRLVAGYKGGGVSVKTARHPQAAARNIESPDINIPDFALLTQPHLIDNGPSSTNANLTEVAMIDLRPHAQLGGARHGWLATRHH